MHLEYVYIFLEREEHRSSHRFQATPRVSDFQLIMLRRRVGLATWIGRLFVLALLVYVLNNRNKRNIAQEDDQRLAGDEGNVVEARRATSGGTDKGDPRGDNVKTSYFVEQPFYHPQCPPHPYVGTAQYPYGLIPDGVRRQGQFVCLMPDMNPKDSQIAEIKEKSSAIKYYPADVFEFDNVLMDLSKRSIQGGYSQVSAGLLSSKCVPVNNFSPNEYNQEWIRKHGHDKSRFMRGANMFSESLVTGQSEAVRENADLIIEEPTVVLTRDDCGNTWHSLADFMKVFVSEQIVGIYTSQFKIMIFDGRIQVGESPDDVEVCPYHRTQEALGRKGIIRANLHAGKKIFFRKLVVPSDVDNFMGMIWTMSSCDTPEMLGRYVNNLYDFFKFPTSLNQMVTGDLARQTEKTIRITVSSRRKKPFASPGQKLGRILVNEEELIQTMSSLPNVKVSTAEFFEMEFKDQLALFRNTDILVGMHGAGLTNLIYTALDGAVVELIPFTWRSNEYITLAQITGRSYYSWQNDKKSNHIEPECWELDRRQSHTEANICRTGASKTVADIEAVLKVVQTAVDDLRQKRKW